MAVPLAEIKDVNAILKQWEEQSVVQGFDPVPILVRLSEVIEEQIEIYYNKNPDPFDERHPSRTDPSCDLGPVLKLLFKKEQFMTKLVNDYLRDNYYSRQNIQKDSSPMNIAACRLMLVIMPGLETSAVFQPDMENLILRLFNWAEKSLEPLQSYATGLLAAAMEVQDIATTYREQNGKLVPLMIQRLHNMDAIEEESDTFKRPFAIFGQENKDATEVQDVTVSFESSDRNVEKETNERKKGRAKMELSISPSSSPSAFKKRKLISSDNILMQEDVKMTQSILFSPPKSYVQGPSTIRSVSQDSYSNSDSSYKRGSILFHPCTKETKQMCILRYLTPMGEYQDFLGHVFEKNALELILRYINVRETRDPRIAFEALKYLAALLCHKKFSIEFLQMGGLLRLLQVPRPSVAATGVSICLYYLAYCEDAMERVCLMPPHVRTDLIGYALSLLKCSHDSGRCHATMFFGLSFQFKVLLLEFDKQGGLRILYNVISVLAILRTNEEQQPPLNINEDEECAARQIVRHVCVALKKYLEAHLYHKYLQVTRQNNPSYAPSPQPPYKVIILSECDKKACKSTPEEIYVQVRRLQELLPFKASWSPVDELMQLDGVTMLLQIIAFAYEWNYSGRGETVRSALDALTVCCVSSRVQERLCERLTLPDAALTVGINIILGAAEGEIVADADVQKSALAVLVNCVSAPIHRVGGGVLRFSLAGNNSSRKKQPIKSSEDLIQRMWESVRSNNGIMVLLQLMTIKTPITDADCIRGMACKALAGLARSDHVKQIVSKLPMFTTGQLQNLMRDPILQEKRQEHVSFQQYAYELLERISGKAGSREFDTSLANIHKANVVAQTRIQFNDKQLLQLIYQHLSTRGMVESAAALATEANLSLPNVNRTGASVTSLYRSPAVTTTPTRPRTLSGRVSNSIQPSSSNSLVNKHSATPESSRVNGEQFKYHPAISEMAITPIKIRKSINVQNPLFQQIPYQRSLEKQISYNETGHLSGDLQSSKTKLDRHISLDTIVTEYLYNQHALCKNPMVTCPAFDLFTPHKCPDPRTNRTSGQSMNFAARSYRRALGFNAHKLDRKFVHSQFCPIKSIRPPENELFFTCCAFRPYDQNLITASYNGEVKIYNTFTGNEVVSVQCHDSYIYYVEVKKDSSMLITSSTWRRPLTCVWALQSTSIALKFSMDDEEIAQFSNLQDKIIGTKGEIATIYDITSARPIQTLVPTNGNGYIKNKATFSPNDDLVLSDGVLWDVSSGKQIHKFDKLNQNISGVFHPNGIEVVSNTEVWDMRTYNLLRTVPALDESNIIFSSTNTIYTVSLEQDSESTEKQFDSSFKTIDGTDYSSIATIDVRRSIYDLAVNSWDTQIAVVENLGSFDSVQESVVRLYDVGRKRDQEDEIEDDEIDSEDLDGSDRSDDNSISDADNDVANMLLDEVLDNVNERPRIRNNRRNRPNRDAEIEDEDSDESLPSSDEDSTFNMSDEHFSDDNISLDDLLEY